MGEGDTSPTVFFLASFQQESDVTEAEFAAPSVKRQK